LEQKQRFLQVVCNNTQRKKPTEDGNSHGRHLREAALARPSMSEVIPLMMSGEMKK
jgi:hypothetical protein